MTESRFLQACRHEAVDATPVWLMRQAGRYMAEYRALREQHSILSIIKTPELACEVTLQPLDAFDLDAAIIFADILPPLAGMGLELDFVQGDGPVIYNPLRSAADVRALRVLPPEETLYFTLDAVKLVRQELESRAIPLIGFSGAPFTLASYAIEGSGSKHYLRTKAMLMGESETWHELMRKLSEVAGHYLLAQAQAGAQALQVFDSWVGDLSPDDYRDYVLPYSRRTVEIAQESGVPVIYFGTKTSGMLDLMRETGADVIGLDWRTRLDSAWDRLGPETVVQGNLDPVALFASWEALKPRIQQVLDQAGGRPGHIFNLGHGILPQTPVDNVRRLVDFVHEYTGQAR